MIDRAVTADGLTLDVHEWGNPAGPEIVLIHGAAQCHLGFSKQTASALARDFRIIAPDLRGHGGSDKPSDASRYQDGRLWAGDLKAVLEAKRLRRPVLVGWSMGGRVIREYLMAFGDVTLGGIVFVAARPIEDPRFLGPSPYRLPADRTHDLAARIGAATEFLRACFEKQPTTREFETMLAYNMLVPHEIRAALLGWKSDVAASARALNAVKAPVLVIHGAADRVFLPGAARMTADVIPGARLSMFDDCGHSPFFEDASRFNRELAEFMAVARG